MRKIICLLLLCQGAFILAQTKPVVTKFGEIVNISPNVNNGLTATNGYIQLGGALTQESVLATTSAFTLGFTGLQTGLETDNILVTDASTNVLKKISMSSFAPYYWGTKGNPGTNPATNFIGTTDANDLVVKTNATERMRVKDNGNVGIGTSNPTNALEITANADPLKLNGLQTKTGSVLNEKLLSVDENGVVSKMALSISKGLVQANPGPGPNWEQTIYDPNVTATSTIVTSSFANDNYNGIYSVIELRRVPGESFTLRVGSMPLWYYISYIIIN